MKLKHGVSIAGLDVMIHKALAVAEVIYKEFGQEIVITAGTEKVEEHCVNSSHAYGRAVDLRVFYFSEQHQKFVYDDLRAKLEVISRHYVLIFHPGHHIHIQWNPEQKS